MLRAVLALTFAIAACADPPARSIEHTFYVDPAGDDLGPGTRTAPFRTLARAQTAVRALASSMTGDLIVEIAPGDYVLDQPLALTEADSGTNGYKTIYESTAGPGTVRVIGGRRITDWTTFAGPILAAQVAPGWTFHTLYEDGVRADEARWPDRATGTEFPMAKAPYLVSEGTASRQVLRYREGDVPVLDGDLRGLAVFLWSNGGHAWFTDIVPVTAIDRDLREITLAQPTRYEIGQGARYFLQGARSLLDAPGEFFLDAVAGTLYYWPRGDDVDAREIIAPAMTTLLSIQGASPSAPVHDLQVRGLGFAVSDFTGWYRFGVPDGEFDRQLEMPANRLGMITLENTERVDVVFCHVNDTGYGGIYLRFANQQDRIYGNLIEHTGINGIALQGGYPGDGNVSHHNVIENNLIRDVGELVGNAAGIDLSNSGSNEISHDVIDGSPRYGLLIHAIAGVSGDRLYAQHNVIDHLAISNTAQDSGDTGALYTFGLSARGSSSRPNTFRQIEIAGASADPSMTDLVPNGVFTDNDSPDQTFEDIRVTGTAGASYRANQAGPQHLINVSWESGFDASRLDGTIGLEQDFPEVYTR